MSTGNSAPAAVAAPHPSAATILTRMRHALAHVHSMRVDVRQTNAHHRQEAASVSFAEPDRVSLTASKHGELYAVKTIGTRTWGHANLRGLVATGTEGAVADALADRWYAVPADAKNPVGFVLTGGRHPRIDHSLLARCLVMDSFSRLRYRKSGSIGGLPAYELISRGSEPGTTKGRLWVSARRPYYPLRAVQTSRPRKGGRAIPECDTTAKQRSPSQGGKHATVAFSGFDAVRISPPPHALSAQHPLTEADLLSVG